MDFVRFVRRFVLTKRLISYARGDVNEQRTMRGSFTTLFIYLYSEFSSSDR
jgi:hypothetical protein